MVSRPVLMSHNFKSASGEAEASRARSGLKASPLIQLGCPSTLKSSRSESRSQTVVLSAPDHARRFPSGLNTTLVIDRLRLGASHLSSVNLEYAVCRIDLSSTSPRLNFCLKGGDGSKTRSALVSQRILRISCFVSASQISNRAILTDGSDMPAIGTERDTVNRAAGMSSERERRPARTHVVDRCSAGAGGGDLAAVRAVRK